MLTAAIVGLGQAGSLFDEEPRLSIWSHAGAYLAMPETFRLVGGADPAAESRDRFKARCLEAEVLADGRDLVMRLRPDVVSICTPAKGRARLVESLLAAHRPKVLVLEKPLEVDAGERKRLVDLCEAAGVPVVVHYNKRYSLAGQAARRAIADGRLGRLTGITVSAPNRLWSMGSHAVDLLLYLAGEVPEREAIMPLPALEEGGEPACDLLVRFPSGCAGRVVTVGFREALVFEADVFGTQGRLQLTGNGARAALRPLDPSDQFVGYRVPGPEEVLHQALPTESTFAAAITDAATVAMAGTIPVSSGRSALDSETLLDRMTAACTHA